MQMKQSGDHSALLRSCGLRATPQRLEIVRILYEATQPMSIPELATLPSKENMDTTTFYRNLEALVKAGLVRKVDLRHEHTDYELIRDHHHHLICNDCGKVEDISWCPIPTSPARILQESHFSALTDHAIEFFGLCKACV